MKALSPRKLAGVAGVVLLHAIIVGALWRATLFPSPPTALTSRERIVWLIFRPALLPVKPAKKPTKPRTSVAVPQFTYPDYRTINLPPLTSETPTNGIHGFLFDCAPENLANLTPELRARCAVASTNRSDDTGAVTNHASRSKNAVRWARALARKQQPPLLPCASPEGFGVGLGTVICLGQGIADGGFDLDAQPGYGDKPVEEHVSNGGDAPDGPPK